MTWLRRMTLIPPFDSVLFFLTCLLIGVGLPILYSASYPEGIAMFHNPSYFIVRQTEYALVGMALLLLTARMNLAILRRLASPALALSLALVVATLARPSVNGAHRWLPLGPVGLQPSELVKIALLLYLASYLARCRKWIEYSWSPVMHVALVVGGASFLLLKQPHLSAVCLVAAMTGVLLILAGLPWSRVLALAMAIIIALPLLYSVATEEQRHRVLVWLGIVKSPAEEYQARQSRRALERGGLLGVGFCEGRQKMLYLPASHNDFVFSCVTEEFGFVGAAALLTLFGVLVWRCFDVGHNCGSQFGSLLCSGVGALLGLQCLAHVGVAAGVLPTTGVTLPFISAGGSALICTMIALGLVLNVSQGVAPEVEAEDDEFSPDRRWDGRPSVPPVRAGRRGAPA